MRLHGLAAQAVVAAELDHHEGRVMRFEQPRQAREPAGGGVARDTGVDHGITVPFALQAFLELRNPRLLGGHPVAAAQRIAYHDDRLPGTPARRYAEDGQHEQGCESLEHE